MRRKTAEGKVGKRHWLPFVKRDFKAEKVERLISRDCSTDGAWLGDELLVRHVFEISGVELG